MQSIDGAQLSNASQQVIVDKISHRFVGTNVLFEHVSFTLRAGETMAICGPSGCGKSTLLSILAGWLKPTSGSVIRVGVGRIGWVFQNPYGVPQRNALDHVSFPLLSQGLRRDDAERKALSIMSLFDLSAVAGMPFSALSGGEAQRLMLARAVCAHPDLLLVDEPTAQLDTHTARGVSRVLRHLAGQGMMVVVATHDKQTRDSCRKILDLSEYTS